MKTTTLALALAFIVPAAFAQKTPTKDLAKPALVDCPASLNVAVSEKVIESLPPGWKLGPDPIAASNPLESMALMPSADAKGMKVACKFENVRAPLVMELPAGCVPTTIGKWTGLGKPQVSTSPRRNEPATCSVKLGVSSASGAGRPACQVTCEGPNTSAKPN